MTTIGEYMIWLRDAGGTCQSGHAADPDIGYVPVIKMISPNGEKHVIHKGNDQSEELDILTIEYFDRRLSMISPFRSFPRA